MVAAKAKVLTDNQVIRIHEASLEILQEVGIEVHNDHARDIYEKHGCQVDRDTRRVLFPVKVVEAYRQMTGGQFTLYGRDPQHDKKLPHDGPLLMNGSSAPYIIDPVTGAQRLSNSADIANVARLTHELSGFDLFSVAVLAADAPVDIIIMGMLIDALMAFDYGQAIIDNEIALMMKQASRPVDTSDEMFSLDLIKETGPGGSFVESDQTVEMRSTAAFEPQVADRDFRANWEARGGKDAKTVALEVARDILTGPLDLLLDREVDAALQSAFPGLPAGDIVLPDGW